MKDNPAPTLIRGAQVVFPFEIAPADVYIENGLFRQIAPPGSLSVPDAHVVDAHGQYLCPGFIDIHTHGAGGADFMDATPQSLQTACQTHLAHGTTSILPTTLTSTRQELFRSLDFFDTVDPVAPHMPEILGLHLEGPYLSPLQCGAQNPDQLRPPCPEEYREAIQHCRRLRRWSFAPELPGSDEFLDFLNQHGILPSLAHSNASCAQTTAAFEKGVRLLTHFYSGMSTVRREHSYRIAGVVEAGYLLDELSVEVIADGCHLPAELLRLIYKCKGADHICLVTDSMRAAGMPDGLYWLGVNNTGVQTIVEDGVAKLPDRSAFAGSVATMDRLVRTMYQKTGAPLWEVVRMASLTPARILGVDRRKGSVCVGKDADLVLLDSQLTVQAVMARGCLFDPRTLSASAGVGS